MNPTSLIHQNQPQPQSGHTFSAKEKDDETGYSYFGARYYDSDLSIWMSVDIMSDKHPDLSPYLYCANNPVVLVDPDGNDWYENESGKITWTDYKNQKELDNNNIKGKYLGQAVVQFNGSRQESPSKDGKNSIVGAGAINASVTVYGPKNANDVHYYSGYTMTSDANKYIPINEGTYQGNYMNPGKKGALPSHWALNATGIVPTMDNKPNTNPDAKNEWIYNTPFKNGIYIHSTGSNGRLGSRNSTGCLLILDSQWKDFNKVMKGVSKFSVQVFRSDIQLVPLQGVNGSVPQSFIQKIIQRR